MTWLVGWGSRLLAGIGFVLCLILGFGGLCLAVLGFGPGS